MLYYEKRLSKSQTISCNSCHDLAAYGADGQPTSAGHKGQHGDATPRPCITPPPISCSSGTAAPKPWKTRPRVRS
jgi:cytochrome c peroxidase